MDSPINEESAIKEIITHSKAEEYKCNHLNYFKDFLSVFTKDAVVTNVGVVDDGCVGKESGRVACNGILTRSNTETYPLAEDELPAEIIICIWHWLLQKKCPNHFQLGLLRLADSEITKELKNAKIQEDLKSLNCKQQLGGDIFFDLLKLQKYIKNFMERLLIRLSDNSKEDYLKNFADCIHNSSKNCELELKSSTPPYVEAHIKNKPRKMEDRHVCLPRFSEIYQLEQSLSFYAVFDGHSGSLAATYAANHIPFLIAQQLKCKNNQLSDFESDLYRDILESTFFQADQKFAQKLLGSGTTAVCALLKKDDKQFNNLYVAWVGDSRCLLVSPFSHLQLVKSHKPDSHDEKKRIESLETGGSVIFVQGQWRVNGIINVSRSIGDYTVKAIIAEPDIVDVPLQPSHDFLILGSDGLYDHVDDKEIIDCVYKTIVDEEQSVEDVPKHLIEFAKQGESQDNITVVLVLLKERQQIKEHFTKCSNKSTKKHTPSSNGQRLTSF